MDEPKTMSLKKPFHVFILLLLPAWVFSADSIVWKVNSDDKSFTGIWAHKIKTPGQDIYSVMARVRLSVDRTRFRLKNEKDELIYDGSVIWHLFPQEKRLTWMSIERFEDVPFWKMSPEMAPLVPANAAGEETIAGRPCIIIKTTSSSKQGSVALTYWVDKEKNLLLKKEYLLKTGDQVLVRETYECEEIEFTKEAPRETFDVPANEGWKTEKINTVDSKLLTTRF
ncbi:MAG: hypothetical protein HY880_03345 [Deltaproteobacteria bacterium]|nr:hypothetical protein [Deltaproteobacteria bacterium]